MPRKITENEAIALRIGSDTMQALKSMLDEGMSWQDASRHVMIWLARRADDLIATSKTDMDGYWKSREAATSAFLDDVDILKARMESEGNA